MNINLDRSIIKGQRLRALCTREFFLRKKSILITVLTIGSVVLLLSFLNNITINNGYSHPANFSAFLMLIGFAISARAFSDIHSKERAYEWFMLPASVLEKFLVQLVITTVGWSLLMLLVYSVFSTAGEGLSVLVFKHRHPLFNPFQRDVYQVILNYIILQSVFIFGAAYFRKNNFIKTVLAVILVFLGIALLVFVIGRVFFFRYIDSFFYRDIQMGYFFRFNGNNVSATLVRVIKAIYFGLFAPFFWFLSYLRITEKEVRNGV